MTDKNEKQPGAWSSQPVTDAERRKALECALLWIDDTFKEERETIIRVLSAQPVDVEALKRVAPHEYVADYYYGYDDGYNAALDHIASEYDLTKKVKA